MIYFDNAATTYPKPEVVKKAMLYAQEISANPGRGGHKMSLKAGNIIFESREKLADFFSCAPECVIFTKNCTEALNTAIKGMLRNNDHAIISSLEHNSVLRPLEKLKKEKNISYDIALVDSRDDDRTVENFRRLIKRNTKLIVCTHVSNVFGTVLPVERIAKLAKKHNICFVLDAAQSAGTFEIDMKKDLFDIVCIPGHKGLFGPLGTGVMLLSGKILPESLIQGGTGSYSMYKEQPEVIPDRFESGTLNLPGIAGLSKGIEFINSKGGIKQIHDYEMYLTKLFLENTKNIDGIKVYDEMHSHTPAPVVSFTIRDIHSEKAAQLLDDYAIAVRGGYHCAYLAHKFHNTADTGTVRVSFGYFNEKNQINFLCFCLNKIAKNINL